MIIRKRIDFINKIKGMLVILYIMLCLFIKKSKKNKMDDNPFRKLVTNGNNLFNSKKLTPLPGIEPGSPA